MSKDSIDHLFERLEHSFDVEEPSTTHKQQFFNKLNKKNTRQLVETDKKSHRLLKLLIGIAASFVLLITLSIGALQNKNTNDLASVSPKMAETQDFFTSTIAYELSKIEKKYSPETQALIKDSMQRMKALEIEYDSLKIDLSKSGDDNRVIYAMISNFQNRINLLQNTVQQINTIKQFKNLNNETSNSI